MADIAELRAQVTHDDSHISGRRSGILEVVSVDRDRCRTVPRHRARVHRAPACQRSRAGYRTRARQQALRRFSAWLTEEGELDSDPLLGLRPPKLDEKIVNPLTDDELRLLLKACQGKTLRDRRDEALVRLMAETGARAGEVASMQLADIDMKDRVATIQRGKGGKARTVPFSPQTAVALDRYLRLRRTHLLSATPALWVGDRGKTFSYSALQRSLGHRATVAGIERFHPHLLRHTAATRWLTAGGSEGGLMAVAGWSSREMIDRYTKATAMSLAAAEARKLNLGDLGA